MVVMAVLPACDWFGLLRDLIIPERHVLGMQAFCTEVLQRPVEQMPQRMREAALPRIAARYFWMRAHGHRTFAKLSFVSLSPAKFAARYDSTEEAIEEWRQAWLLTPEGRIWGSDPDAAN